MLGNANFVAFVAVTDLEKARAFYVEILGLEPVDENSFVLEVSANGTALRLALVTSLAPQPFTMLGWNVLKIGRTITDLRENGVELLSYDGLGQDENGVWVAPDGAKVAWFKDPDGNTLSVTESP